ncbi:protein NPC2-like protein [Leptotrombidium deliense]|uniref:Protein NPC2-like protein n=1 Tax=Leptotrombidium deliense TaxID=299467 RepID=A0A443S394_9ACAR|nr:protein NPC2-like protein [Leptotrombidium deliense]
MFILGDRNALKSVKLENCNAEADYCILKKGNSYKLNVNFESKVDSNDLTTAVTANVFGVQLAWPGLQKNACEGHNIECPIKKGQSYNYNLDFEVMKAYPTLSTKVTFKLKNDQKSDVICFTLPVNIVD